MQETEHFQFTLDFLQNRDRYLRHLFKAARRLVTSEHKRTSIPQNPLADRGRGTDLRPELSGLCKLQQ